MLNYSKNLVVSGRNRPKKLTIDQKFELSQIGSIIAFCSQNPNKKTLILTRLQ